MLPTNYDTGLNTSVLGVAKVATRRGLATLTLLCSIVLLQACSPDPTTEIVQAPATPDVVAQDATQQATVQTPVQNNTTLNSAEPTTVLPSGDSSRTALDWDGTYQGVLPCASCEGIETRLTLTPEGSYHLVSVYLGEAPDNQFEQQGTFDWDDKGTIIRLNAAEGEPVFFKVEENALRQLDQTAEVISGPLAEHYRLNKVIEPVTTPAKVQERSKVPY